MIPLPPTCRFDMTKAVVSDRPDTPVKKGIKP